MRVTSYFNFLPQPWISQLWRQSLAAGDRRVEWHVAEKRAAVAITAMVQELNIKNIDVIWDP